MAPCHKEAVASTFSQLKKVIIMAMAVPAANKAPKAIPVFFAQAASIIKCFGNLHSPIPQRFPEPLEDDEAWEHVRRNVDESIPGTLEASSTQCLRSRGAAWESTSGPTELCCLPSALPGTRCACT